MLVVFYCPLAACLPESAILCLCFIHLTRPFPRFPVGRCVYKSNKVKRVVVCKRRSRLSVAGSGPCRRAPSAGWPCDMANKENELTCAGDVQAIHYNDNCGFPVNSAEASKMAGAGTKYSDFFTEVCSFGFLYYLL